MNTDTTEKGLENLIEKHLLDLYKRFTDDADFKHQYLDFVFDSVWQQHQAHP